MMFITMGMAAGQLNRPRTFRQEAIRAVMQMNGMNGNMAAVRPTPSRNGPRSLRETGRASRPTSATSVMPARTTASSVATAE